VGEAEHLAGELDERPAANLGAQAVLARVVAERVALLGRPVAAELPGAVEGGAVVEQSDPERGQRAEPPPRPAVGAGRPSPPPSTN